MLSLTIALIVLNLSLGIAILLQGRRDLSAQVFFLITLAFSVLSFANFNSLTTDLSTSLMWVRVEMFLAAWHTFFFFVFVHIFTKQEFPYTAKRSLIFFVPFVSILYITLSPYLFASITENILTGELEAQPGKLFPIFALWLFATMALSMRKVIVMWRTSSSVTRVQWKFILMGSFTTYLSLIIFNFVFTGFFHDTRFLPYTPLYSLPIVIATAYAIIKHNLFDIKVLATQAFVSIMGVLFFAKIATSTTTEDRIMNGVVFLATVFFGVLLVRSVKKEVEAREEVRKLANKLGETNWQLARSNEKLRILDQRKSEFVSIASHQLRTPVTAIKGYASLILEDAFGDVNEKAKEAVSKIFFSAQNLVSMINDFLNVSKIEQGTMTYSYSIVEMGKLVRDAIADFHAAAGQKALQLEAHVSLDDIFNVRADESKIRQIVTNLIDNAIKYTPGGRVDVYVERDETNKFIHVRFTDTGIGLSQDDLQHIFAKFARGEESGKVNSGGSGLGLFVARKMLEEMGGKIWVDSKGKGKGATFVIELSEAKDPNAVVSSKPDSLA